MKRSIEETSGWLFIAGCLVMLALMVAPALAQTTYTNMPISCARAEGLQANAAACTDAEQFQRPASASDVVLSCASATCDWYAADLQWRKFSAVPDNFFVVVCPAASSPGPMNCPGAVSPVWGGLAYVPKAQVTVASTTSPAGPVLPPLTSGETYIVKWTQPTTNTDGTPIGTITATEVQASTSPTFETYYLWTANTPGTTTVTVVNGPTGTVYWRARVFVGTAFSDYSATAITEREYVAQIKPPCWPKPVGTGTWVKGAQNADGFALYWQCTVNGAGMHTGFIGNWPDLEPDWVAQLTEAISTGSFDALWNAKITGPSQASKYATVRPLWEALKAANPLPVVVPSTYVVKPNGAYTTRPTYSIVGGARTSTVAGRVAILASQGVATTCDCDKFSSGADPNRYCSIEGRPNVATADPSDTLGASAALCTKAATTP